MSSARASRVKRPCVACVVGTEKAWNAGENGERTYATVDMTEVRLELDAALESDAASKALAEHAGHGTQEQDGGGRRGVDAQGAGCVEGEGWIPATAVAPLAPAEAGAPQQTPAGLCPSKLCLCVTQGVFVCLERCLSTGCVCLSLFLSLSLCEHVCVCVCS